MNQFTLVMEPGCLLEVLAERYFCSHVIIIGSSSELDHKS